MFENKIFKSSCNLLIECREYSVKYLQYGFQKVLSKLNKLIVNITSWEYKHKVCSISTLLRSKSSNL